MRSRQILCSFFAVLIASVGLASAADRASEQQVVRLFEAMEAGDIEVQFIASSSAAANVIFTNRTQQPLRIELPAAFAGVPVLAQFGNGPGAGQFGIAGPGNIVPGGNFGVGAPAGGAAQGVGGGFNPGVGVGQNGAGFNGAGFNGANFNGGGFFNIDAGSTRRLKVETVCLEHGKPDPNPRLKYELRPIEALTSRPEVAELCAMLGRGEIPQAAAQAAAWHVANDLSWEELAAKDRVRLRHGYYEKYFSQEEISQAVQIVEQIEQEGDAQPAASPGDDSAG